MYTLRGLGLLLALAHSCVPGTLSSATHCAAQVYILVILFHPNSLYAVNEQTKHCTANTTGPGYHLRSS